MVLRVSGNSKINDDMFVVYTMKIDRVGNYI